MSQTEPSPMTQKTAGQGDTGHGDTGDRGLRRFFVSCLLMAFSRFDMRQQGA